MYTVDYDFIVGLSSFCDWKASCAVLQAPEELNALTFIRGSYPTVREVTRVVTVTNAKNFSFSPVYDNIYDVVVVSASPVTLKWMNKILFQGQSHLLKIDWVPTGLLAGALTLSSDSPLHISYKRGVLAGQQRHERGGIAHEFQISDKTYKISRGNLDLK